MSRPSTADRLADSTRTLLDRRDTNGVFDLHFSPHRQDLAAAAMSNGRLELFEIAGIGPPHLTLMTLHSFNAFDTSLNLTTLSWDPGKPVAGTRGAVALSLSNGHVATMTMDESGTVTGNVKAHAFEVWTCAWSQGKWEEDVNYGRALPLKDLMPPERHVVGEGHFLYSGGDDSMIKAYDMVCNCLPEYDNNDEEDLNNTSGEARWSDPTSPMPQTENSRSSGMGDEETRNLSQSVNDALNVISEGEVEDREEICQPRSTNGSHTAPEGYDGASESRRSNPNHPAAIAERRRSSATDAPRTFTLPATTVQEIREIHLRGLNGNAQRSATGRGRPHSVRSDQPRTNGNQPFANVSRPHEINGNARRRNRAASRTIPVARILPHDQPAIESQPDEQVQTRGMDADKHCPKESNGWARWDDKTHASGVTAILPLPVPEIPSEFILTGSYDEHIRLLVPTLTKRWKCRAEIKVGGGVWRLRLLRRQYRSSRHTFIVLASLNDAGAAVLEVVCDRKHRWRIDVAGRLKGTHGSMVYAADAHVRTMAGYEEERTLLTVVTASFYDKKLCTWQCMCATGEGLPKWQADLRGRTQEAQRVERQ